MNSETQRISVCERVEGCNCVSLFCFCVRVLHISHGVHMCVCVGRGLKIPKQALLEMITLIKPLLSKLPPPSICSLNTPNQAQVCPDAFTPFWLTTFHRKTPGRGHFCDFLHLVRWQIWMKIQIRMNVKHIGLRLYCFLIFPVPSPLLVQCLNTEPELGIRGLIWLPG